MNSRASEMPSYEFEVMLRYMTTKVAEFGMAGRFDQLDLADILIDHDVTTIDRLPDVVSLARNLQSGSRSWIRRRPESMRGPATG